MAQSGDLTEDVANEFDAAVRWLADDQEVSVITGDCGFMMWFQARARSFTTIPIFLSALQQLPTISAALCKHHDKVIVLTANVHSLRPMQDLINGLTGTLSEQMHFVYVGCEDVPFFGEEVEKGLKVDVDKAEPGILARAIAAVEMYPQARAFLFECTELPPYSDTVRAATGLPVYDSITNCDFVMGAFLDNSRFGREAWYKPWDGKQNPYHFGKHLNEDQRLKLVSHPINEPEMHTIMDELGKTDLLEVIKSITGLTVQTEQLAHAIAAQVEQMQVEAGVKAAASKMKKKEKRGRIERYFRHAFVKGTGAVFQVYDKF